MSQTFLVTATVIFCQIVHLVQGPASPVSSPQSHKNDKAQYSSSGLADFFQEPKLGTTWYNPNGPTPTFDMKQENASVYNARLGSDTFMSCQVKSGPKNMRHTICFPAEILFNSQK